MKFARLLLQRLMPMLAALAFLALPASSEPLCNPHNQHACFGVLMASAPQDDAAPQDPASLDHGIHAHCNCHVPMTQPEAIEFTALGSPSEAVPTAANQSASSTVAPTLERPPRA